MKVFNCKHFHYRSKFVTPVKSVLANLHKCYYTSAIIMGEAVNGSIIVAILPTRRSNRIENYLSILFGDFSAIKITNQASNF